MSHSNHVAIKVPLSPGMSSQGTTLEQAQPPSADASEPTPRSFRLLFYLSSAVALVYAFLNGFRTIAEFDLGWQLATARWIVQHHHIPSVDVLSYTASGQPWIYPIGAGLLFYAAFLIGGYALISWLTALSGVAVTALILRRGSIITAVLAILAVPLIASRLTPRAEIFTIILFAATLSLLWEQHQTGKARLWLLPVIMVAWVNLHAGFVAGLALLATYLGMELLEMCWPKQRALAICRLQRAWPWLLAMAAATLVNPWGWNVFQVIARQEAAMGAHSQLILEWAPIPFNASRLLSGLSLSDPDPFYVFVMLICLLVPAAIYRRQIGAAAVLAAITFAPLRHMRFTALFAIVVVIVGGSVLTSLLAQFDASLVRGRARFAVAVVLLTPFFVLVVVKSKSLYTDQYYLSGTNLVSFGSGLSWWFPDKAAAFVERENLPGEVFSSAEEGGFLAFRLGPKYRDYIDSRAIPFGTDAMVLAGRLKGTSPNSPLWRSAADRYGINAILLPIGRFSALQFFPMLKQFCESDLWTPVYLDEVSVVFLRRTPQAEPIIQRLQINCATGPLPTALQNGKSASFNQWANAASVLRALGRDPEAMAAANRALSIVPNSGYLHFLRGHMFQDAGNLSDAENDYRLATQLEPNLVAPWSALAEFYQSERRLNESIDAWQHAADASRSPWEPLMSLGYANLQAHRPKDALAAFDRAADSLPAHYELMVDNNFLANIAHGRSRSYLYLGDLRRAITFDEQAVQLLPDPDLWLQLASLYERAGRIQDANRLRAQVMSLSTK